MHRESLPRMRFWRLAPWPQVFHKCVLMHSECGISRPRVANGENFCNLSHHHKKKRKSATAALAFGTLDSCVHSARPCCDL